MAVLVLLAAAAVAGIVAANLAVVLRGGLARRRGFDAVGLGFLGDARGLGLLEANLQAKQRVRHLLFDLTEQLAETLRRFAFVGDDRVLLAIGAEADTFADVVQHR